MLFFNYNRIKPVIIHRKITGKSPNTWKLNTTLLNNPWVKVAVSREIKTKKINTELSENMYTKYHGMQLKKC